MSQVALVTGGAGFIGSNLVRLLLDEGWAVRVLDDLSSGHRSNVDGLPIEFIQGDIRNETIARSAVEGCNVVFHLAASVGNARGLADPIQDSSVNVLGTLSIIRACVVARVGTLVYSSSAAIFGELQQRLVGEEHPIAPITPYGVSKLAGEKHVLCMAQMAGIRAVCLRYFNVYGVNQRYDAYGNVIPIFAQRIKERRHLTIYGDGQQTRDFVNARDVAQVNVLAATTPGAAGVFNVGSGTSITINELARKMIALSGQDVPIEYAPRRPGDVLHCQADIRRLSSVLGFKPAHDLDKGLREYLGWFEQNGRSDDHTSTGTYA